jgi:hypothetical protein
MTVRLEALFFMTEDTFYLIDFENVGLKGLEGAEKLTRHDHVYLFSTRNAPKIDTATLSTFNNTNFEVHEVPAKSQSLDMHLVSYLGFLLGKYIDSPKLAMRVVIVSNDTDYDDVAQFWNRRLDISVSRRERFHAEAAKAAGIPLKYWNLLQKGNTIEEDGVVYTPEMVMGPARRGIKMTYCTDSRPTEHIVEAAKGSDLFICEGMYGENDEESLQKAREKKHMTMYEAAEIAKKAQPKEMWLTHYSPYIIHPEQYEEEVRKIFPRAFVSKDRRTK